jgi:hypothetical protein
MNAPTFVADWTNLGGEYRAGKGVRSDRSR